MRRRLLRAVLPLILAGCGRASVSTDACPSGQQDYDRDGACQPACATAALDCGEHGFCADFTGVAACACEDGFQDRDGNGGCEPTCAAADLTCGINAACDDASGTAECACKSGYHDNDSDGDCWPICNLACGTNATCNDSSEAPICLCDAGFQDHDGDGDCVADCSQTTCGLYQSCDDASGVAVCACLFGFQDYDGDGDCSVACARVRCGQNTTCDDVSGIATCRCLAGLVDDDGDGDCWPTCTDAALECGSNAQCQAVKGVPACVCDAGYQDNDGDGDCLPSCAVYDCATNLGTCDDSTGVALCTCDADYQDNDSSGDCKPDCSIAGLVCDALKVCSDASGTAACVCDAANGWQDNDNDGTCTEDCGRAGLTCGTNEACDDSSGTAACACAAGYQDNDNNDVCTEACGNAGCGANTVCDDSTGVAVCSCAPRFQDVDGDGDCSIADGLSAARGLATGTADFTLASGVVSLYVDGAYDGGGWVLVGRGREGWSWNDAGNATPAEVAADLGTTAAFVPKFLFAALIDELIDNDELQLWGVEIRLKRAAATDGSAYQEVSWRPQYATDWTWLFDAPAYDVFQTVADSVLGDGHVSRGPARDTLDGTNDDQTRVFTWAWSEHNSLSGFSYGAAVDIGTGDATSFLWQYANEGAAIPYTEVYVRGAGRVPASCAEILAENHSAADGAYTIDPDGRNGATAPFDVWCDMTTAGGGWTLCGKHDRDFGSGWVLPLNWGRSAISSAALKDITTFPVESVSADCRDYIAAGAQWILNVGDADGDRGAGWDLTAIINIPADVAADPTYLWDPALDDVGCTCTNSRLITYDETFASVGTSHLGCTLGDRAAVSANTSMWTNCGREDGAVFSNAGVNNCGGTAGDTVFWCFPDGSTGNACSYGCCGTRIGTGCRSDRLPTHRYNLMFFR